ncbi:hypothetical protein ALT1644_310015 [Alteromonas macleodii]
MPFYLFKIVLAYLTSLGCDSYFILVVCTYKYLLQHSLFLFVVQVSALH